MTDIEYSRKERSISRLISIGSMYPSTSGGSAGGGGGVGGKRRAIDG